MQAITRRAALALPTLAAPGLARAQAFPNRPVTWIVPNAAGGVLDVGARLIAAKMMPLLGQPVVVENRPGAGTTIGIAQIARAAPDGYTIGTCGFNGLAVAPLLIANVSYDARRDFLPVLGIGAAPNVLVCGAGQPFRDVRGLIERARANPDAISYASTGIGTGQHLAALIFCKAAGVTMTHVPYTAFTQAAGDMMAGRIEVMFDFLVSSMPLVREGRLRALAVTAEERLVAAPEVPTIGEAGLPGAELLGWSGLYVPARTPQAAIDRLAAAARVALRDPEVQALFDTTGSVNWGNKDAAEMQRVLEETLPRMRDLVGQTASVR